MNCPNCGAPEDLSAYRCPYCGTPYPREKDTDEIVLYADDKPVIRIPIKSER